MNDLIKYIPDSQIRSTIRQLIKKEDYITARMIVMSVINEYKDSNFVTELKQLYNKLNK
jgi:hypothetical protein